MEKLKAGLLYKVFCTGFDIYRIGAVINDKEAVYSGNIHFLDEEYPSREEVLTALQGMVRAYMQPKARYHVLRISSARFLLGRVRRKAEVQYLPCVFPNEVEANEALAALSEKVGYHEKN